MTNNTASTPVSEGAESRATLPRDVGQFSLNHPKNYFGVPLTVAAPGVTDELIGEYLVQMPDRARAGAEALGLITADGNLTELGETVVGTITAETTLADELETFGDLKGTSDRFVDVTPRYWNPIARHVLKQNPLTGDVVTLLEKTGPATLPELTAIAARHDHPFHKMVLRDPDSVDGSVTEPDSEVLAQPDVYAGQAVYQFKNLLFHAGILTERGADTSAVIPAQDVWALEPSLISLGGDA